MPGLAYVYDRVVEAGRISLDFELDGDLDKAPWTSVSPLLLEQANEPPARYPEARTEVSVLWRPSALYIGFRCRFTELNLFDDPDVSLERWELWNRDVVEVFINPFPEHVTRYWEFEVSPRNQWIDLAIDLKREPIWDAGWNSGFTHATRIDENSRTWCCEMRLPVSAFALDCIRPEQEWRVNFYRCDGPGDDSIRRFLAWCPTCETTFHVPARFGRLVFSTREVA
jgi:alpha-galactosidase